MTSYHVQGANSYWVDTGVFNPTWTVTPASSPALTVTPATPTSVTSDPIQTYNFALTMATNVPVDAKVLIDIPACVFAEDVSLNPITQIEI